MLNHTPDFNRLRVFYFVFKSGSVTSAAETLHLTKSAVSQSVKLLEGETGHTLFVKTGRALTPTSEAKSLFEIVEPFYRAVEERFAVDTHPSGPSGLIRLSAPPLFGSKYILPTIQECRKKYPRINFQVNLTASIEPLKLLENDRIDFCIVDSLEVMFGNRSHFLTEDLLVDPEDLVCSKNYWKNTLGKKADYETLIKSDFISYHPNGAEICFWLESTFKKSPKVIKPFLVVDTPNVMLYGIKADLGLGLVPASMIQKEIKNGSVISVSGKKHTYQNKITLVSLREKKESQAQALFVEEMMKRIKKTG